MTTLKVRITGPHEHAGRVIPVGEVVELPAQIARLMCSVYKTAEPFEWPEPKKRVRKK